MAGRPPKPTELKIIAGNPGGRPLPKNILQPDGNLRNSPIWFSKEQRETWFYAIENAPLGLLRLLDRDMLITWVTAQCDFVTAEKELQKTGLVILKGGSEKVTKHKNGEVTTTTTSPVMIPNPWTKIRNEAFLRLMKATTELGFSPTSRARITLAGAESKAKDLNRFANNVNRRAS